MGCLLSKKDKPKKVTDQPKVDIKPVMYDVDLTLSECSPNRNQVCKGSDGITRRLSNGSAEKKQKFKSKCDSKISAKYEVKALIGKGTFSRVVRVEHRVTKQPYAMKVIDCRKGRELFEAELSILRRVRHPNIIHLIEVMETQHRIYLMMELAIGGDLFDRIISRGFFTERDAIRVLKMVLDGVRYLHGLGITHRDLKPDNLLYYHPGNDSRLMITDFGLACTRRSGGDAFMYTACGTPEYISPEIVSRRPYTSAVDLWAVGVIAYILLAGTFPFDDENTTRLYKKILRAEYSFSSENWVDVSPLAKDFISKLLVVNPEARMTAAEALRHPWLLGPTTIDSRRLQRSISHSIFKASTKSSQESSTSQSIESSQSTRSRRSLHSDHRRVCSHDLDNLQHDPEVSTYYRNFYNLR